jgi:hypothetical protein
MCRGNIRLALFYVRHLSWILSLLGCGLRQYVMLKVLRPAVSRRNLFFPLAVLKQIQRWFPISCCYCMILMQPSIFNFIWISILAVEATKLSFPVMYFSINQNITFQCNHVFPLYFSWCWMHVSIMYVELFLVVHELPERWQKQSSIWQLKNDVVLEN